MMNRLGKLIMAASFLGLVACDKNEVTQQGSATERKSATGSVIEANLNYSSAVTMEGIASIKYQAGQIPAGNRPKKGYKAPDLGNLTIEEVIYYLEATHNFDAPADAIREADGANVSFNFSMPLIAPGESKIDQDELVLIYDRLFDDIITETPTNMQVQLVNVYGLEVGELMADFQMDVFYTHIDTYVSNVDPLDATDNWYAFQGQGQCPGSGNGDATSRLEELVNWYGAENWNGSSGSSLGGGVLVCANGLPIDAYVNVAILPMNSSGYYENGSLSTWPLTDCLLTLCLNQSDMESNLVSFFNYTNNTLLTGQYADHYMTDAVYDNDIFPAGFGQPCYVSSSSNQQYRHLVKWTVAEPICGTPLPW